MYLFFNYHTNPKNHASSNEASISVYIVHIFCRMSYSCCSFDFFYNNGIHKKRKSGIQKKFYIILDKNNGNYN